MFNLNSIEYTTKTRYSMFKLINFLINWFLENNELIIWWLQHVPKQLGQGHFYHCVTSPFLLTTLNKRLGTEDTNCWSFVGGILSHSCLMYSFSCSTVRGLRCRILRFIMRHTFSMEIGSGLQAGQSSTRTLLLRSHAVVKRAECGLALSCWNKQGRPWKRRCLDGSMCCSKTCMYLFSINGAFTDVQVPHATGTNTAPYHHRCWLLNFASITVRMVPFPLWSGGTRRPHFPKTIWNVDSSDHRTLFHLASVQSQMSSGPREVDGVSGCCWWMAFALHSRVLGCTYGM